MHHLVGWPHAFGGSQFTKARLEEVFFPLVMQEEKRLLAGEISRVLTGRGMFSLSSGESAVCFERAMESLGGRRTPNTDKAKKIIAAAQFGKLSEMVIHLNGCGESIILVSGLESAKRAMQVSEVPVVDACLIRSILALYPRNSEATCAIRKVAIASALLQGILRTT